MRNVRTVDLGVNTEVFRPEPDDAAATRSSLGIPPDSVLLLYVGRLAQEKNTQTLFKSFELLTRRRPGAFSFAGDRRWSAARTIAPAAGAHQFGHFACSIAPTRRNSRASTAPPICLCTPAFRRRLVLSRSRVRRAGPRSSAFAGATWTASFFTNRNRGREKTLPEALADAIEELSEKDLQALGASRIAVLRKDAMPGPVSSSSSFAFTVRSALTTTDPVTDEQTENL